MSKDESIQEQRQKETQLARQSLPEMIRLLRQGAEPLSIAREEANRLGVDLQKIYKWTVYVGEEFEKRRRRTAIRGAVLLWGGFFAAAITVALALFGGGISGSGWMLPASSAVLVASGLYIAITARRSTTVPEELFD